MPFTVGHWSADPRVDELARDGRVLKLEPRTMRLLVALAQAPGELVTTDSLFDRVWPGLVVTPGSLYEAVAQLRKALGPDHVATVPRKGYRLVAPVGRGDMAPPSLGPRSIAVLPFRTRQLAASHDFVRESLADDLIGELSRQPALAVVARGTMLGYATRSVTPQAVSRELGVRHVVDGLLEQRGQTLQVTVQVVDGELGTQTWADTVELPLADWPDTGPLVAARLARALNFELLDKAARVGTGGDTQALALATRAWLDLFARPESRALNERAATHARQALALDPALPLALSCLAFCEWRGAQFGWIDDAPRSLLDSALAHVERAIDLDPRDPDAHYVLGLVAYSSRNPARAEEALRQCLRLSRSHAPAYGLLALIRTRRGFPEEAAALCERAFALSPREPLRAIWHLARAWAALALHDYRGALHASEQAMAVNPDFATSYVTGAAAAQQLGLLERAATWVAHLREHTVFNSLQALHARLPPPSEAAHERQLAETAALLRRAGLPEV